MEELDNLNDYNGDPQHDMWVDFDFNENTGELPEVFDEDSLDNYINNLNDWD